MEFANVQEMPRGLCRNAQMGYPFVRQRSAAQTDVATAAAIKTTREPGTKPESANDS